MDELSIQFLCGSCKKDYTETNFPLQSATCGHSICLTCLDSEAAANANNNDNNKNGATKHEYFGCPICHQKEAFHLEESKPNLLALSAFQLLARGNQIMKHKLQATKKTQAGHDDDGSPTRPNQVNNNDKATTTPTTATSSPAATSSTTPSSGSSTTHPKKRKISLSPSSSPTERMVWVKFGQGAQLAFLLNKRGNKATIRWESSKYEEEVSMDMIEELDNDKGGTSSRGSRRTSKRPMSHITIQQQQQQQSKKRRVTRR